MTTSGSEEPLNLSELQAALSAAGNPWTAAQTSVSQLPPGDQVIRLGVAADPSLPDHDEATAAEARSAVSGLERVDRVGAFDLRNVNGVNYDTPVKDQGHCGSCVAFGTVATIENVYRFTNRTQTPIDLSEAQMFYCYARFDGAVCASGWFPDRALTWARDDGVTFEQYFPYTAGDQTCALKHGWQRHLAKVTSFDNISGKVAPMKSAIVSHGSVTACMNVYQDFVYYRSGVYRHVSGELRGGHCVVLIGYEDAAGCWIARNSWGLAWGDSGHFRIGYGECGIESRGTFALAGVNVKGL